MNEKRVVARICTVDACGGAHYCRGFCRRHYSRFKRYGDPLAGKAGTGQALIFIKDVVLTYSGDDCLLWPFRCQNRYPDVFVDGKVTRANRYVCSLVYGPPSEPDLQAAHSCGNTRCLNPRHLRWATCLENIRDKESHGTKLLGERNPKARLSREDVVLIRSSKGRVPAPELARRFGVTYEHILGIQKRRAWGWLEDSYA